MKKNTIIYIGGFMLPDKNAAAQRVISNGKILDELGYNVVYIGVTKDSIKKNMNNELKRNFHFTFDEIKYPQTKLEWFKYMVQIEHIKKMIEDKYFDEVKAVIAYNYPAVALYRLKKYCNKKNIKVYADCTEWYGVNGKAGVFKFIKYIDTTARMSFVHKKLDGVICISKYLLNVYNSNRSIIIPPLVDMKDEKWKKKKVSNSNCIKFIYSGSPGVSSGKNAKDRLDIFIEFLYSLNDQFNFLFEIIGITKEEYIYNFPEEKSKLDELGKKVIFKGRLTHEICIADIKKADFLVFLRNNDRVSNAGFPTKFVEGIACGTPIITNKTSDIEEYLVDGKNGYFINPNNYEECIEKLKIIINLDSFAKEKLKENCIKTNKFNYLLYVNEFKKFISL